MRGYGSGSWYCWSTKALITSCLNLDVRRLHREGLLRSDGFSLSIVLDWGGDADRQR